MAVLYNQFGIIEVISDLKTKSIVIATNFKVDPSTVDLNTVTLYDYSAGKSQLTDYSIQVDGKNIILTLNDYPGPGTRFYLKVTDIYDALNRKINYAYNDYIIFDNEVITTVEVISPGFREVLNSNILDVKLKVKDALEEGAYKIQISSDNAFFNTLATIVCNATLDELTNNSDSNTVSIAENNSAEGMINFRAEINYNGQVYIRGRAEKSDSEVGRWSEMSSFSIYTVPMDSMDTSFLENSLSTYELFPDEILEELEAVNKTSIVDITDGAFFIEFNKAIKLPEDYEVDEDGYVSLGTITGFRKELK